jgi:hypothetical protein
LLSDCYQSRRRGSRLVPASRHRGSAGVGVSPGPELLRAAVRPVGSLRTLSASARSRHH